MIQDRSPYLLHRLLIAWEGSAHATLYVACIGCMCFGKPTPDFFVPFLMPAHRGPPPPILRQQHQQPRLCPDFQQQHRQPRLQQRPTMSPSQHSQGWKIAEAFVKPLGLLQPYIHSSPTDAFRGMLEAFLRKFCYLLMKMVLARSSLLSAAMPIDKLKPPAFQHKLTKKKRYENTHCQHSQSRHFFFSSLSNPTYDDAGGQNNHQWATLIHTHRRHNHNLVLFRLCFCFIFFLITPNHLPSFSDTYRRFDPKIK